MHTRFDTLQYDDSHGHTSVSVHDAAVGESKRRLLLGKRPRINLGNPLVALALAQVHAHVDV